jgi:cytochrome d ubiquinol oxidase subunit II
MMETLWFTLIGLMLIAYVVLDGFDLGAGILHLFVAKTDGERQMVLGSIGPFWDGNEVWLLAAGGALYFAFPVVYASSFSGFYLPLIIVLWLLMFRGVGIELRPHIDHAMWRSFFDFIFSAASLLLAIFFGAAIGNVMRGVPLNSEGYFFEALWSDFRVGSQPGILDWYTVLTGVLAMVTLAIHGANWIALKTEGDIRLRASRIAQDGLWVLLLFTILSLGATLTIRPQVINNFRVHVWGWLIPAAVAGSLIGMRHFRTRQADLAAFLCSTVYIAAMLGGAAFALYPVLLPASSAPALNLTIYNSKTGAYSLRGGLIWWLIGVTLAIGYFVFVYRFFRGKAK